MRKSGLAEHGNRLKRSQPCLGRFIQIAAHEDAADTVFAQQPLREVLAGFSILQSKVHERQVRTRLRHHLPASREILDRAKNGMLKLFELHLKV